MQCCSPPLLIEAHRGIELQATAVDHISLSLSLSLCRFRSVSHSHHNFTLRLCPVLSHRFLSLSLSLSSFPLSFSHSLSLFPILHNLSLSAYLVLNYPNSISVQLQFIPVSKRQSRRVHFASARLPPEAIISFLHTSSPPSTPFQHARTSSSSGLSADRSDNDGCSRFKRARVTMYNLSCDTVQVANGFEKRCVTHL